MIIGSLFGVTPQQMIETCQKSALVIGKLEHTANVYLRDGSKEGIVDWLCSGWILERPADRTPGLNRGEVWVRDDFDDPLPDTFWLGDA